MHLVMDLLCVTVGCVCAFALFIVVRALYRSDARRHMYELPLHERLGRFGHEFCRERFWAKAGIDLLDRVTTQAALERAEHRVLELPPSAWQHGPECGVCRREARHTGNGLTRSEKLVPDARVRLCSDYGLHRVDAVCEHRVFHAPLPTAGELDHRQVAQADVRAYLHAGGCELLGCLVRGEEVVCGSAWCPGCGYAIPAKGASCVMCDRAARFQTFFCEAHDWAEWQALVDRTASANYRLRGTTSPS